MGDQAAGIAWLAVLGIASPLIALLVVIGLVYEGVIRIDRPRMLPSAVHWALASAVGILLIAVLVVVVYRWLFPALA